MTRPVAPRKPLLQTLPTYGQSMSLLKCRSHDRARTGPGKFLDPEEKQMNLKNRLIGCVMSLAVLFALEAPACGEEKYSVSGIVTFSEGEVVFVALYTQDRFNDFKNRALPPEPYTQVIELSAEQKSAGKAEFSFKDIPRGTYGVIAFREIRKNLKKDRSQYFKAPVSSYKMISFSGNWNDVKFEVNKDVRGIEIRF